jgi:hypothetical protein
MCWRVRDGRGFLFHDCIIINTSLAVELNLANVITSSPRVTPAMEANLRDHVRELAEPLA